MVRASGMVNGNQAASVDGPPAGSESSPEARSVPARPLRWELPSVFLVSASLMWQVLINQDWEDQYFFASWAERITEGQVPYRDFFMHLWPGHAYLLAFLFLCFGVKVGVLQWTLVFCNALAVALAHGVASSVVRGPTRWLASIGMAAHLVVGSEGLVHMNFAAPLALAAIWMALLGDRKKSMGRLALAGALAALTGLFTQTMGVWLGFSLVLCALLGPREGRFRRAAATAAGGLAVVGLFFALLAVVGAFGAFYADTVTWALTRYTNWHAGVHWGSWMPGWEPLGQLPAGWCPTWFLALALCRLAAWVFPALPVVSAALWLRPGGRDAARRILWIALAGLLASAWPHGGAMRLVRLSGPVWILIAFECGRLATFLRTRRGGVAAESPGIDKLRKALVLAPATALLLTLPLQHGYRYTLARVETPRGRVCLKRGTAAYIEVLARRFKPGDTVLFVPPFTQRFLLGLRNPTGFDGLMPIYHAPEQLERAVQQIERKGCPPIVHLPLPLSRLENIIRFRGITRFKEEFVRNPLSDFVNRRYSAEPGIGTITVLRARGKAPTPEP
jgi:hypothetical protein